VISIVIPDLRGGGAERVMIDLAQCLKQWGHHIEFALMSASGDFLDEVRSEFSVVDLGTSRTRSLPFSLALYFRQRRPSHVIANMWGLTSAAVVARAISRKRFRLLLVEHSTLSKQYKSWGCLHSILMKVSIASTYRFADDVAAVSVGAASDTASLACLPIERVKVVHNPIPARRNPSQSSAVAAARLWNCEDGLRVLSVGSLKQQKNHSLLLRAFAKTRLSDARLILLGQGELEGQLRRLAVELGIADRVIFAGFHADPSAFYATANLLVLSSDYEGFGNVIVEALSFGLPVVSTDCQAGPAEILQNGRFGTLTPVGDVEALARAIDSALVTPVDHDAQKRRAADFAPDIAARKYLDLLGLP